MLQLVLVGRLVGINKTCLKGTAVQKVMSHAYLVVVSADCDPKLSTPDSTLFRKPRISSLISFVSAAWAALDYSDYSEVVLFLSFNLMLN